ncbi:MAG: hypothetical protein RL689_36 [Planctomycetota bacterium]
MRIVTMIVAAAMGLMASAATAQRSTPVQVTHPAGAAGDIFGRVLAMDGDTLVVGAPSDDVGVNVNQGSVHVYRWTGAGWTLEATLAASGAGAFASVGLSVAISGDTLIAGAPDTSVGSGFLQGAAFVFVRSGTTWTQQASLSPAGTASGDNFGIAVAISGDTAIVGASDDDVGVNADQGSAFVFRRLGTTWTQQAQLTGAGGAANDQFGSAVAISGDTAIVGAFADDVGANVDQGTATIFVRSGSTWAQQAQLTATGGAPQDRFGSAVAILGDTAVVGAFSDDVGANVDQGTATVFARSGSAWAQQTQLTAAGAGFSYHNFGWSVSLSGETLAVATRNQLMNGVSQGSAVIFTRSGASWTRQATLTAPDAAAGDEFGESVAVSGDMVAVGAQYDDIGASVDVGSAWIFSRVGSRWIGPDLKLLSGDGRWNDQFGWSIAVSGDTAIVGAPFDDVGANNEQGSAYVFTKSGSAWVQQAQLIAAGGMATDYFGRSVAISGDTAIVGAPDDDVGSNVDQGSAYVFTRSGSTWTERAHLTDFAGSTSDKFGRSVAISGETVMVGTPWYDVGSNVNQGVVHVFNGSGATWTIQQWLAGFGGGPDDEFGAAIAIDGDVAIIGAPRRTGSAAVGQGAAFVFRRSGSGWAQEAWLDDQDGQSGDQFGFAVAVSGNTVVVGAPDDDLGATFDAGSATIFGKLGTTWSRQARLIAPQAQDVASFGFAVAIEGDMAAVGVPGDRVAPNHAGGSVYLFGRTGSSWGLAARASHMDGPSGLGVGFSLAINGGTVFAGAPNGDAGNGAGTVHAFDVALSDLAFVRNDVAATSFSSLAAAMLPAAGGQQLTATEAAWRGAGSLNTFGRSLGLFGSGDVRVPSTSVIDVGGSSALSAAPGSVVDLFGQLRVSGYVNLEGDAFRLGSRGILTTRTASSLSINAPVATIDGQVRIEQGASLTAAGDWTNIGPVTMSQDAAFTAGGLLRNIDAWTMGAGARAVAGTQIDNRSTWTMTAGELMGPLVNNLGAFNVFGTSAIFGRFTNNTGATTTVRSGALFVFGDLVNNGTVIGTICSTCSGLPPAMDVGGTLSLGPSANLTMPFAGSVVRVGGSFESRISSNTRFDMAMATLQMESDRPEVTLEVMSRDIGVDPAGLDRTLAGHFPIGELHIGGHPTTVRLEDAADNARDGGDACEALYVDTLRIDAGSRLVNERCRIYYNTLINDGTVDVPANLIPLQGTQPCPADFNQDGGVDGGDVDAFFVAWESGDSAADVNQDGGVDGGDIDVFFAAWEAGGC